ncbi:MAG: tRNA (adenosine(37)-N6)-threonylcarbamoyltransferase complex ATPase subunit type 1 TsaE [Richelia sp. RM2_1_2]|nr:tRNA (adenosine(37)-N6)-threonylcarbamoyltransferase complex ATPase subunit type 1 TsaE [Richelia sp. SM2_1_7]NJM19654.1 tRNA (adenosine(37)-N6)-threonylcarbamoyltransferase complex ATPase subunit type 1 TsaE [Richelia sp. SM1_7_0]NJN11233.1 tRNA (adenosine(37)-N6)-threonylcarbamoyltransferase complex ATPase subunit type 1 TsaE [Richelia sp. RM1_1_1]NJO29507.1 tRNA (adenosine(37)-N6)-threonylcarbamoyltransferase complex ATPase subunit type 1 TsaE [Richelia sp. SL_2_1]NJO59630.1 tRNA (adenosi
MKILLEDALATQNLGIILGKTLTANSVILLEGDLGTGKTTLVQGIGEGLGINETIVSPTFNIINEYTQGRLPLYHLDLYRLESREILGLNLETYWEALEVAPGIVAIEWAQRMPYKPSYYLTIHLTEDNRDIQASNSSIRFAEITPFNCTLSEKILSLTEEYHCQ